MQDNSDFSKKISIRHFVLSKHDKIDNVADCYAGCGIITKSLWQHVASHVFCIEKNITKLSQIDCCNVTKIHANNFDCINIIANCEIFDCDAYGLAMPFVKEIAKSVNKKWVVFSDGTPEKARKVYSAFKQFNDNCKSVFSEFYYEQSSAGNAYYGYGLLK